MLIAKCSHSLPFQTFVDRHLAAFLYFDDPMYRLVARKRNVDYVGAGIEEEVDRRELVENAVVDRDLRPFGLGLDVYRAHARRVAAAEQLLEFAAQLDVIG